MKTSELSGAALDWAVAIAEGKGSDCEVHAGNVWYGRVQTGFTLYSPSRNWLEGGPIIERENISVMFSFDLQTWVSAIGELWVPEEGGIHGPTPLVAAMRCYVASKLGDEIEIPGELSC